VSEHISPSPAAEGAAAVETGFEPVGSRPGLGGPVGPVGDHDGNGHVAQLYERRAEKFAAAVPFVRRGLERGDRVMYVVDESTEAEVRAALRDAGIDVDDAFASGALSFHTVQETYLRNGSFDTDEMIEFYGDAVAAATEEYEALRIVAEMTWVADAETSIEQVMEYEQRINALFDRSDSYAVCQYDRELFSPSVVRNVVRTHPYLVYDGVTCHNPYYTPPEEFLGEESPARENERLLGMLRDRAAATAELHQRERFLRRCYEVTADPTLEFESTLERLFDLGRRRFDLSIGGLARVDREAGRVAVEHVGGDCESDAAGLEFPLWETVYELTLAADGEVSVVDATAAGHGDRTVHPDREFETYLGTALDVDGDDDRVFFFASETPRDRPFSDSERTALHLMGQWIEYELERRRRERDLRERTEQLSALVETTPECIKTVAEDGTILQMNPAGAAMVGADAGSDVVDECVYGLIAPEHRDRYREFNERVCGGERGTLEFDIVGLDGARRHMESHAAPLSRPDGTTAHVALTRDVTEYREYQRRLEASNERLEQFAYAASHDLQEPLRMVTSYLQLLEDRYGDAFDADGEEFLAYAVDGAERMRAMIDGLLEYSRVETQGDPFESVDLEGILDDVREDLQVRIDETDAEVTAGELPRVSGDRRQVRQVFQNLLRNALTYTEGAPRVHVDATRRDGEWTVSVRDDGIGIEPDAQERIFTVFDRLHGREEYDGTGLGLALCQRIVERHGGEIWVDSEPGEGSTFAFTLPADE